MNNAGDGTHWSGVYSTDEYPASESTGIDAELSTPVSLGQWQSQRVAFLIGADSVSLANWDHHTGFFPNAVTSAASLCGFSCPAGAEGAAYAETIGTTAGRAVKGARWLGGGAWYRVRVQLLPDGRCAVAVNGRPIGISPPLVAAGSRVRVALFGQSYRTRMLVGHIEMFRGVKTDEDWSLLDTAPVTDTFEWRRGARHIPTLPLLR